MKKYTRRSIFVVLMVVLLLALLVPVASAKGDAYGGGTYHTVSYGETLFSIGRYYGVSAYQIARANNLYDPNYIYAGQVLYIPSGGGQPGYPPPGGHPGYPPPGGHPGYPPPGGQPGYPPSGGGVHHTVSWGETLSNIAYRYGSSVWAITQANNLPNPNCIYAGQVLYIPSGNSGGCGWNQGCGDGSYYPPYPEQPIYYPPVPVPYY